MRNDLPIIGLVLRRMACLVCRFMEISTPTRAAPLEIVFECSAEFPQRYFIAGLGGFSYKPTAEQKYS